jgi:hypothetical protein
MLLIDIPSIREKVLIANIINVNEMTKEYLVGNQLGRSRPCQSKSNGGKITEKSRKPTSNMVIIFSRREISLLEKYKTTKKRIKILTYKLAVPC